MILQILISWYCVVVVVVVVADDDNKPRTSYFNSPALDVSLAFPQATPASTFPPCSKNHIHHYTYMCTKPVNRLSIT